MYKIAYNRAEIRAEMAEHLKDMRRLRQSYIYAGKDESREKLREEYLLQANRLGGFIRELLETNENLKPLVDRANKDVCSYSWDPLQGVWEQNTKGRQFIVSLWRAAVPVIGDDVRSEEDVFHFYQALKLALETDPEVRRNVNFVLPCYGGVIFDTAKDHSVVSGYINRKVSSVSDERLTVTIEHPFNTWEAAVFEKCFELGFIEIETRMDPHIKIPKSVNGIEIEAERKGVYTEEGTNIIRIVRRPVKAPDSRILAERNSKILGTGENTILEGEESFDLGQATKLVLAKKTKEGTAVFSAVLEHDGNDNSPEAGSVIAFLGNVLKRLSSYPGLTYDAAMNAFISMFDRLPMFARLVVISNDEKSRVKSDGSGRPEIISDIEYYNDFKEEMS